MPLLSCGPRAASSSTLSLTASTASVGHVSGAGAGHVDPERLSWYSNSRASASTASVQPPSP
eukprot:4978654-Pyramimonas_sp.AAC.1